MNNITFENDGKITSIDNIHVIRSRRREMKILDDPEGFFKDMSDEEFIKLLDEFGFDYELKKGV